jgi:hypothetical protein
MSCEQRHDVAPILVPPKAAIERQRRDVVVVIVSAVIRSLMPARRAPVTGADVCAVGRVGLDQTNRSYWRYPQIAGEGEMG